MTNHVLRQLSPSLVVLAVLTLFGWGCKGSAPIASNSDALAQPAPDVLLSDAPPADAESKIPAGWKVYENEEHSVKVAYPGEWYASADVLQNPQPPDLQRVFFDPAPIQVGLETEPSSLVMLESWSGTVGEVITRYEPDAQQELQIGGRSVVRFTYGAEFFGNTKPVALVFVEGSKVYLLQRLDGNDTYLETMLATLEVR